MTALCVPSIFHIFEAQKHESRVRFSREDMSTSDTSSIEQQKSDISGGSNTVKLSGSCIIGNGILRLSELEKEHFTQRYTDWKGDASFFVPASGSGSRMFSELAQFVESGKETEAIARFFQQLPDLALFHELPLVVREKFEDRACFLGCLCGVPCASKWHHESSWSISESRVCCPTSFRCLRQDRKKR